MQYDHEITNLGANIIKIGILILISSRFMKDN